MRADALIRRLLRILPERISAIYLKRPELWLYLLFGFLAMLISISIQYAMAWLLDTPAAANAAISWIFAAIFAFFMNKYEIFDNRDPAIPRQMAEFLSSRLFALLFEIALMLVSVDILGASEYIMKVIAQIAITILNYLSGKNIMKRKD